MAALRRRSSRRTLAPSNGPYVPRNTVTLYASDYGLVGDDTTDDTTAMLAMLLAAHTRLDNGASHVIMQFDSKSYLIAGAPTNPDGTNGAYSVLPIRKRLLSGNRGNIEFRGVPTGMQTPNEAQTVVQKAGTILRFTSAGTYNGIANAGLPSCIGGPAFGSQATQETNVRVILSDITIRRPDDASIAGVDLFWCSQAKVRDCFFDTNVAVGSVTHATNTNNIGLLMPTVGNNAVSDLIGGVFFIGCYVGLMFNEHCRADHLIGYKNRILMVPSGPNMNEPAIFNHVDAVWQDYVMAGLDMTTGAVKVASNKTFVVFGLLSIEDAAVGNAWESVKHFLDTDNIVFANGLFQRVAAATGPVKGLTNTGGLELSLRDLLQTMQWINLTLQGTWASFGGNYSAPGYRKDRDGVVHLRGLAKTGAAALLATLPTGYRPGAQRLFVGSKDAAGTVTTIDISGSSGAINIGASGLTYVSLDGIHFLAEN